MQETESERRKRLRYRSQYRGNKEMDLILGAFATRYMAELTVEELDLYEALLAADDLDIYDWVTGRRPVPAPYDTSLMALLRSHKLPSGTN